MPTSSISRPSEVYTNWDFGLKRNHLATLSGARVTRRGLKKLPKMFPNPFPTKLKNNL
jgi:hypothetical protein